MYILSTRYYYNYYLLYYYAACLMWPRLFYACFVVSRITIICNTIRHV